MAVAHDLLVAVLVREHRMACDPVGDLGVDGLGQNPPYTDLVERDRVALGQICSAGPSRDNSVSTSRPGAVIVSTFLSNALGAASSSCESRRASVYSFALVGVSASTVTERVRRLFQLAINEIRL